MTKEIIFWNTDTQYDFMRDDEDYRGKLAVPNARTIEPNLEILTRFARENGYRIVNTADIHTSEDEEISRTPDMINTYPMHCERDTLGSEFVPATRPVEGSVVDFMEKYFSSERIKESREIIIYKNRFDVYAGNPHTSSVIDILDPKTIVHYGVATNVCVDQAVMGSIRRGLEILVVKDAIMGLPHLDGTELDTKKVMGRWKENGVKIVTTKELLNIIGGIK